MILHVLPIVVLLWAIIGALLLLTITTPIVEKIKKLEKLIIDGKVTLMDDDGKPMKKVDYRGDHDSEDQLVSF